MSISDQIVVMKEGIVQQTGKPQEVYDDPVNLFVAKFLGTPPINVFVGHVQGSRLYIGADAVLGVTGVPDGEVYVGVRPEGFVPCGDGPFACDLRGIEVMGRDTSLVLSNEVSLNPVIRAIVGGETPVNEDMQTVRFELKSGKVFLFDQETEKRMYFEGSRL